MNQRRQGKPRTQAQRRARYLLRDTTFIVIGKEELKKKINKIIDEEFRFLDKHLKKANEALAKLK